MLPLSFAARNLSRSWIRTVQIAGGTCLAALLLMAAAAFEMGMRRTLGDQADPHNVILLGKGSEESIQRSEIPVRCAAILASSVKGLKSTLGQVHVSPQILYNGYLDCGGRKVETSIRGVDAAAARVHKDFQMLSGAWPGPGQVMVGRHAAVQMGLPASSLAEGAKVIIDGQSFTVSGCFAVPGSLLEAEVWMNLGELLQVTKRDTLSCVVVTLDTAEFGDIEAFAAARLDLETAAVRETDYYARLSGFYAPIRAMVWLCSALVAFGAVFGGFNTLFTAFGGRKRELAALQAIGFPRWQLAWSLLQEALLACLLGAAAALFIAVGLLDGLQASFAGGVFILNFGPGILLLGLLASVCIAVLGLIAPVWVTLRPALVDSLR